VYASSVAAYDALEEGEDAAEMQGVPSTLYGVYKRANEGTAQVYAAERGVRSVGLRPHTVYGPGRDQGLTSAPTLAMLAAAAGRPYELPFGGAYQLQYAPDVAAAFVESARGEVAGAELRDLGGPAVHTDQVIEAIAAAAPDARVTYKPVTLPFPSHTGDVGERTSLTDGVADAVARFRDLLGRGLVAPPA
jgi:nucleoside-diphosphate-sugar epimerase